MVGRFTLAKKGFLCKTFFGGLGCLKTKAPVTCNPIIEVGKLTKVRFWHIVYPGLLAGLPRIFIGVNPILPGLYFQRGICFPRGAEFVWGNLISVQEFTRGVFYSFPLLG